MSDYDGSQFTSINILPQSNINPIEKEELMEFVKNKINNGTMNEIQSIQDMQTLKYDGKQGGGGYGKTEDFVRGIGKPVQKSHHRVRTRQCGYEIMYGQKL